MSMSYSERLKSIDEKLAQIVELLMPKETKIKIEGIVAPNNFSVDSEGNVNMIAAKIKEAFDSSKVTTLSRETMIKMAKLVPGQLTKRQNGNGFIYTIKGAFDCYAEYIVNKEKRTVVCLLRGVASNRIYNRGKAKCDPNDVFNVDIGKAIALYRALGMPVPVDYFNIPRPDKFEVGQVIFWVSELKFLVTKDRGNDFYDFKRLKDGKQCNNHFIGTQDFAEATIIEDGVEV